MLQLGKFRLNIRINFFPVRLVQHWNRLPRVARDSILGSSWDSARQSNSWCDLVLAAALPPMWDRSRGIQRSLPPSTPMLVWIWRMQWANLKESCCSQTLIEQPTVMKCYWEVSCVFTYNGKSIFPTHTTHVIKLHQSTSPWWGQLFLLAFASVMEDL